MSVTEFTIDSKDTCRLESNYWEFPQVKRVLTLLNPLSRRKDGVQNVFLFRLVFHWGQCSCSFGCYIQEVFISISRSHRWEIRHLHPNDFLKGSLGSTPLEIYNVMILISNHKSIKFTSIICWTGSFMPILIFEKKRLWLIDIPQLDYRKGQGFHEVYRRSFLIDSFI